MPSVWLDCLLNFLCTSIEVAMTALNSCLLVTASRYLIPWRIKSSADRISRLARYVYQTHSEVRARRIHNLTRCSILLARVPVYINRMSRNNIYG